MAANYQDANFSESFFKIGKLLGLSFLKNETTGVPGTDFNENMKDYKYYVYSGALHSVSSHSTLLKKTTKIFKDGRTHTLGV